MTRTVRLVAVAVLVSLTALPVAADDKDFLRPRRDSVPPNLLIVFGNSQTLTQTISFTGLNFSTFDGDGDSRGSKMGAAKRVIQQFVQDFHTDYNIGLTSFSHNPNVGSITISRKHWVYAAVGVAGADGLGRVDYPGDSFAEPIGTLERWGTTGTGGPCTTLTVPDCSDRSPIINLTATGPDKATVVGPFFGPLGGGDAYIYLNGGSPSTATRRIHLKMVEGEYGDGYTDGALSALKFGTYSVKVRKTYQERQNRNVDWPTGASATPGNNPGEVDVLYRPLGAPVPPSTDPADRTLFYLTDKKDAAGVSIEGQSIGFLNDPQADFSVNANCSGWEFQTNSAQVPLVKIPRDYYWGAACSPPQDSVQCIRRVLRPQAYIETYDQVSGNFSTHDPDNPGYTIASADKYLDQCDPNLLGAVQAGLDIVENNVILTTRNGSQAPIKNLLDNILAYFSDPRHDGFKNGARLDDPNAQCRNSAVILIYDNFNGCQNDTCSQLKNFNLNALKAIGVPVYVIGFGASAATGICAGAMPPEGCPLVCIPKNTGAFQSDGATAGYFPVTTGLDLYNALASIADLVNESQKGFASSTVATAQANGEQVAFLATFNALNNRTIWNGRINAYKLDPSGNLKLLPRTIRDTQDPNNNVTVLSPSNNPGTGSSDPNASIVWNAGENLADTPGTGATNSSAVLTPGATLAHDSYPDASTDQTFNVATSFYPGRKIVFSLPVGYPTSPGATTLLPFRAADTVPEIRFDMVSPAGSSPFTDSWWLALKALLSPQPVPPTTTTPTSPPAVATPLISDTDAVNSLRFIWGDRDPIILDVRPSAPASFLYAASAADRAAGRGLKLGDVFHSSPILVGPPSNFAYFTQNLHDYQAFRTTYQRRRRVLAFGANDGLLHIVDAGAWDRDRNTCDFEADLVTRKHCFDLGTGAELFAYAPRATMQIFKALKDEIGLQTRRMEWTVDGPSTAGDVFMDSNHTGSPQGADRTWHTVLIGGMREGSPFEGTSGETPADSQGSYYALDITQPDALITDSDGKPITSVPGTYDAPRCLNSGGDSTCGHDAPDPAVRNNQPARAWPTVLWEITDVEDWDASGTPGFGYVDMGETWSKPALGRVKVCSADCGTQTPVNEDHYVAIFGGGFDRERLNRRGNWLYMVDVETGKVLYRANSGCANGVAPGCSPIPFGSVASEPAAIDGNSDGYIDVIYVGDLNGRMWRIDTTDLRLAAPASPSAPRTERWQNKINLDAGTGKPFLLFEAPQPATPAVPPRPNASGHPFYPIYYRPTVIALGYNVGGKPAVGVGFGTGDRDDITGNLEPLGLTYKQRFYYVVDRNNGTTLREPSSPSADFVDITSSTAPSLTTAPANGWFLELALGERINADTLTSGGVIYFTTFNPLAAGNSSNACAQNSPDCGLANGTARLYRVYYTTGNPYLGSDRGETQQYGGFLSEPVYFQSLDQQGNIIYTTENTVKKENAPGGKKTTVKSWKERSGRP